MQLHCETELNPVYRCTNRSCMKERSPFDEELGLEQMVKVYSVSSFPRIAIYSGVRSIKSKLGTVHPPQADTVPNFLKRHILLTFAIS